MRIHYLLAAIITFSLALQSCSDSGSSSDDESDTLVAVRSSWGMVSSASQEATAAGVRILESGGNAVDAAVGVGFALAVTLPQAGNLGGGGFMVVRMADGRTTTIDFRETAPAAATRDMYLDSAGNFLPERSQLGALAAGVPGSPAGLLMALEKFGSMPRAQVMAPAVELAEKGFTVHPRLHEDMKAKLQDFSRFPGTLRALAPGSALPAPGAIFTQPDLAATLRRISDAGASGFYSGRTADLIVAEMQRSGGIITHEDLKNYKPTERKPIIGTYRGDTIISMPPPSSGGILLVQMLNMMEGYDFSSLPLHSARQAHIMAEIMRRAYADRAEHLGDPDFWNVPAEALTSKIYARQRILSIDPLVSTPSDRVTYGDSVLLYRDSLLVRDSLRWQDSLRQRTSVQRRDSLRLRDSLDIPRESPQTTHYSVVDRQGNCVSVTVTLNASFGSKLVVDGAGFLLNNEMDDFSAKPGVPNLYGLVGNEANAIAPGKRMLSSMTPTIVTRNGEPLMVLGSPGGSTIITTVLQVIQNQTDYGMELPEAVEAPRMHHQWRPDTLFYEKGTFGRKALDSLKWMNFNLVERTESSGRVDAIRVERDENGKRVYLGWSDRRGYGTAMGPERVR